MKEDKYIEELVGKRNPFVVPEGYFEQLTDQVMDVVAEGIHHAAGSGG